MSRKLLNDAIKTFLTKKQNTKLKDISYLLNITYIQGIFTNAYLNKDYLNPEQLGFKKKNLDFTKNNSEFNLFFEYDIKELSNHAISLFEEFLDFTLTNTTFLNNDHMCDQFSSIVTCYLLVYFVFIPHIDSNLKTKQELYDQLIAIFEKYAKDYDYLHKKLKTTLAKNITFFWGMHLNLRVNEKIEKTIHLDYFNSIIDKGLTQGVDKFVDAARMSHFIQKTINNTILLMHIKYNDLFQNIFDVIPKKYHLNLIAKLLFILKIFETFNKIKFKKHEKYMQEKLISMIKDEPTLITKNVVSILMLMKISVVSKNLDDFYSRLFNDEKIVKHLINLLEKRYNIASINDLLFFDDTLLGLNFKEITKVFKTKFGQYLLENIENKNVKHFITNFILNLNLSSYHIYHNPYNSRPEFPIIQKIHELTFDSLLNNTSLNMLKQLENTFIPSYLYSEIRGFSLFCYEKYFPNQKTYAEKLVNILQFFENNLTINFDLMLEKRGSFKEAEPTEEPIPLTIQAYAISAITHFKTQHRIDGTQNLILYFVRDSKVINYLPPETISLLKKYFQTLSPRVCMTESIYQFLSTLYKNNQRKQSYLKMFYELYTARIGSSSDNVMKKLTYILPLLTENQLNHKDLINLVFKGVNEVLHYMTLTFKEMNEFFRRSYSVTKFTHEYYDMISFLQTLNTFMIKHKELINKHVTKKPLISTIRKLKEIHNDYNNFSKTNLLHKLINQLNLNLLELEKVVNTLFKT